MLNKMLIVIIPLLALLSCSDDACILDQTAPITADFSDIEDPRERWEAYGITDYVLEQDNGRPTGDDTNESYQIVVENGRVIDVVSRRDCESHGTPNGYFAIEFLFDWISKVDRDSVETFYVQYHPKFGYPSEILITASPELPDRIFSYSNKNLERLK